MRYEGYNGQIITEGNQLTMTRDGAVARALFSKDATWSVSLQAVTGVEFDDASRLRNGRLRVLVLGQNPPASGPSEGGGDEVLFTHKHRKEFGMLRDWLQGVADKNREYGVDFSTLTVQAPPLSRLQKAAGASAELDAKMSGVDTTGALFTGTSHESGRNAVVTLYPDRIERTKAASFGSLSKARQDVEVTPLRAVSSVQAKKDGMMYTKVFVYASGNAIEFRFPHSEASHFKTVITDRIVAGSSPAPVIAQPAQLVDVADQLLKLAALRDQGILTEEEFVAQKAKLLS